MANTAAGSSTASVEISDSLREFQAPFEASLSEWLRKKEIEALDHAPELIELTARLREFIGRGGKRLRPALVWHTYHACGGVDSRAVLPLAMSTELLHAYLLIHDDIMDCAEIRRGEWTVHRLFEAEHERRGWQGNSVRHGESVAVLLGDLSHSYADELFLDAHSRFGNPALAASFQRMCQEVVLGQYLEMTAPFRKSLAKADLLNVLRLKSGRYSVERPVELGAIAARAGDETATVLREYGEALGEAFQLKDDLLGVFGSSANVGKSVDSDIAEGKFTVLIQQALEQSTDKQERSLRAALGNREVGPEKLETARQIVEETGARRVVEEMIERRLLRARRALAKLDLDSQGASFLEALVDFVGGREH